MTALGKRVQIPFLPSVNPIEDSTELDTIYFTEMDKCRFQDNKLRKINGWARVFAKNQQRVIGAARNIFSYRDAENNPISIIGTHRSLYALLQGSVLYNITPLSADTTAIPNSISTEYNSSVSVMVDTEAGSDIVTLHINQYLNSNELIKITGVVSDVNGIPAANFNDEFYSAPINNYMLQINVGAPATSTGSVAVTMTWATSYIYVYAYDFGGLKGDRIKIADATTVANISSGQINKENVISNLVNDSMFVIQTDTIANASVTNGGGANTEIQYQIAPGNVDQSIGYGYGGGEYGAGLYGTAKEFTDNVTNSYPRIWSMDKWQDPAGNVFLIVTPGDGAGANLYSWDGDIDKAPTLINNAPHFVHWVFVSHNSIVTLGGAFAPATLGIPNFIAASDIADMTIWTPSPDNYAFFAQIDQASALISQASSRDSEIIFADNEIYKMDFVDKPYIWRLSRLFSSDGIIAPKARVEVEDAVIWMGKGDFFVFNDTSVSPLPENRVLRYVFDNINTSQSFKNFAFANAAFNEVWFFYCAGDDIEPNNYVIYNYKDRAWAIGTLSRTAAEEFLNISTAPYLIQSRIQSYIYPDSIRTYFLELGADPLNTTSGTQSITFDVQTLCYLTVDDYIEIKGATAVNGIPDTEINGIKQIKSIVEIGLDTYTIEIESTSTNASSTGSGGGAAITVGTAVLGFDISSSRIDANELISVVNAPSVGGISQALTNIYNGAVRALVGTVVQVLNMNPDNIFSQFEEVINNDQGVEFAISYMASDRLFQHEVGLNDYNENYVYGQPGQTQFAPMRAFAQTNMAQVGDGDTTCLIYSVYPDTNQTGDLTLEIQGKLYAQSNLIYPSLGDEDGIFTITPETTKVDLMFIARQRQYRIESYELDGNFLIGKWFEEIKLSSTR